MSKISISLLFLILASVDVNLERLKKPTKSFIAEFKNQLAITNESKKQNSTTLPSVTTANSTTRSTSSSVNVINLDYSDVSFRIYNQLVYGKSENTFVSPFSLINSLFICYFGTRNETANQLKQFLRLGNLTNSQIRELFSKRITNTRLNQANRLFVNDEIQINSDFKNILTKEFHADIVNLNTTNYEFATEQMNNWVKDASQNKIENIITDKYLVNKNSALFLTATYFSGKWLRKFSIFNTNLVDFYLRDGTTKKVQMMRSFNEKFKVLNLNLAGLEALACEFPYADNYYSMTIIMPKDSVDIQVIEASLTSTVLNRIIKHEANLTSVNIFIPKFKIITHFDLSHYAQQLNIPLMFDKYESNLAGISEAKNQTDKLYMSKFMFKSVIEINELGTDATVIPKLEAAFPVSLVSNVTLEFKCNKPFIFFIHSKTDILLIGKFTGIDS